LYREFDKESNMEDSEEEEEGNDQGYEQLRRSQDTTQGNMSYGVGITEIELIRVM